MVLPENGHIFKGLPLIASAARKLRKLNIYIFFIGNNTVEMRKSFILYDPCRIETANELISEIGSIIHYLKSISNDDFTIVSMDKSERSATGIYPVLHKYVRR